MRQSVAPGFYVGGSFALYAYNPMPLSDSDVVRRQELAISAAREAGRHTLTYFQRRDLVVERKSDTSPVTVADRQAESLLRDRILAAFPDDGILGEEMPEHPGKSGFRWILDPIDGTKSFISGVPLYGTLVAGQWEGQSVLGVIYIPGLDECLYGAVGQGAWLVRGQSSPERAQVSQADRLSDGLLLTSELEGWTSRGAVDVLARLENAAWFTRTWGDCYGYLLVATGRALAMIDPVMSIWDTAALKPILEEAGGTFTDWKGTPTVDSGEGIATNGRVFEEIMEVTRPSCRRD